MTKSNILEIGKGPGAVPNATGVIDPVTVEYGSHNTNILTGIDVTFPTETETHDSLAAALLQPHVGFILATWTFMWCFLA